LLSGGGTLTATIAQEARDTDSVFNLGKVVRRKKKKKKTLTTKNMGQHAERQRNVLPAYGPQLPLQLLRLMFAVRNRGST
jgi:hypothetical protein